MVSFGLSCHILSSHCVQDVCERWNTSKPVRIGMLSHCYIITPQVPISLLLATMNKNRFSSPVYKEMRKFDRNPYQSVIPAEIRYCKEISAWVFTHENIRKSDADDEVNEFIVSY